jgi:predicted molibdopterin-dependent oxidoreductase YjgC
MFRRLETPPTETVEIIIEGRKQIAAAGDTVAAALLVSGLSPPYTRTTPVSAAPRAPLCLMGVCYECLVVIDGRPNQRACQVEVRDGMRVDRQHGPGELAT